MNVEHNTFSRNQFIHGCRAGLPIAFGYLPIAVAFGLLANSAGVPASVSILMSFLVFAGASQFVAINLLSLGTSFGEIILTTMILNLRHLLMSASLSQRIPQETPRKWLALIAFGITDETFTVASLREEAKLTPWFLIGLNLVSFSAWNLGTWVGVFFGATLPSSIQSAMGIALYTMFIGLLIPSVRQSFSILVIALTAAGVHSLLHWLPIFGGLSTGWNIIIATMIAALFGAMFYSEEVDHDA